MSGGHPATGPENGNPTDPTGPPEPSATVASETLYDGLAGYGFARRYVGGKVVANIGRKSLGYGSRLLSQAAEQVVGLTDSAEVAGVVSRSHPAPNVEYGGMEFPTVPYPDGHFDVVVALEEPGPPERLVNEARRVLKPDGVLILSTLDRRALLDVGPAGEGRRQGMYVSEFRALLGRHFGRVRVFRRGAVAGGFVFPEAGEITGASVESAPSSATLPPVGPEPPATRWVLAVCSPADTPDGEGLAEREGPYLLLDRDRRVFDEGEDLAGAVELLRSEIGRMQETEAQAFRDSYRLLFSEIAFLRAQVRRSESRARRIESVRIESGRTESGSEAEYMARIQALQDRIRDMENSATWRVFEPYRWLRSKLDAAVKGARDK